MTVPDCPHAGDPLFGCLSLCPGWYLHCQVEEENVPSKNCSRYVIEDEAGTKEVSFRKRRRKVLPERVEERTRVPAPERQDCRRFLVSRVHVLEQILSWSVAVSVVVRKLTIVNHAQRQVRLRKFNLAIHFKVLSGRAFVGVDPNYISSLPTMNRICSIRSTITVYSTVDKQVREEQ